MELERNSGDLCDNCNCHCEAEECICDLQECMFCVELECDEPWNEWL